MMLGCLVIVELVGGMIIRDMAEGVIKKYRKNKNNEEVELKEVA